jgi:hypothetical protein
LKALSSFFLKTIVAAATRRNRTIQVNTVLLNDIRIKAHFHRRTLYRTLYFTHTVHRFTCVQYAHAELSTFDRASPTPVRDFRKLPFLHKFFFYRPNNHFSNKKYPHVKT